LDHKLHAGKQLILILIMALIYAEKICAIDEPTLLIPDADLSVPTCRYQRRMILLLAFWSRKGQVLREALIELTHIEHREQTPANNSTHRTRLLWDKMNVPAKLKCKTIFLIYHAVEKSRQIRIDIHVTDLTFFQSVCGDVSYVYNRNPSHET